MIKEQFLDLKAIDFDFDELIYQSVELKKWNRNIRPTEKKY
jgi:hypothetical protein